MNTQKRDEIIDRVDADNWEAVLEAFEGGSLEEITATLNDMYPTEDNGELAQMIFDEVVSN